MEEVMNTWTLTDLMHLTCLELCVLACRVNNSLREFEVGSLERLHALTTLENIRRALALRKHQRLP
jgi:hypothetical protein